MRQDGLNQCSLVVLRVRYLQIPDVSFVIQDVPSLKEMKTMSGTWSEVPISINTLYSSKGNL